MTPAPLPQPAPFTCPRCGVALQVESGLCPRCGAQLQPSQRSPLSVLAAVVLTLGLLVFGAVGACGALFTLDVWPNRNRDSGGLVLSISAFSLLIGLIGVALCLLPFFRRKR